VGVKRFRMFDVPGAPRHKAGRRHRSYVTGTQHIVTQPKYMNRSVILSSSVRHLEFGSKLGQTGLMTASDPPRAGETSATIVVVVLAAGAGIRFCDNGHKLAAMLPATGRDPEGMVLDRALAHAISAGIGPVVVVTGAIDPPLPPDVVRRHNADWADGQMSSLQAGIETARGLGAAAVVIGLGDQPAVSPSDWRRVAATDGPIVVATYNGRRGNPVKLTSSIWDLLPRSGDEGGRSLMRIRPDLVVEVPCTSSPADIDTVEDLRRWQSN
jgi:molybdenum cofactor cytidylyltransferase